MKISVQGSRDEGLQSREVLPERFGDIVIARPRDAVRIGATRAGGEAATVEIGDDQVVELTLDGGVTLYLPPEDVSEMGKRSERGGAVEPGTVMLPAGLPIGDTERGVGAWLLKGLRALDIDLGNRTASAIGKALDESNVGVPGVYAWTPRTTATTLSPTTQAEANGGDLIPVKLPRGEGPLLVFLHGTFSSVNGSFGDLPRHPDWTRLCSLYAQRMFALEHRTLTESPIANAIALLEALKPLGTNGAGQGPELHLVSHSRGGLIGELLARAARTDGKPPFEDVDFRLVAEQANDLKRLNDLLLEVRPRITRFVRVACPARGTTLASDRLDKYLNVVLNAIGQVLSAIASPAVAQVYDFIKAFLLAVIAARKDGEDAVSKLPGLEAMRPESGFIRMLNRADVSSAADLSVIKGDVEAAGLLRRLQVWAADAFYREDHDFVVNTGAMDGGVVRAGGIREVFDRGAGVNHFSYFRNERTARLIAGGLTRGDKDNGGFAPPASSTTWEASTRRSGDRRPVVFVVPGFTGSLLDVDNKHVWQDLLRLACGDLVKLDVLAKDVQASGLMRDTYEDLCRQLEASHEVIPFHYDWRLLIEDSATVLANALRRKLDEHSGLPVRIVAHSMGGLVARTALGIDAPLRQEFAKREGSRLVMLGTPNGGSHSMAMLLMGRDRLMRMLALLDVTRDSREHLQIISRFPGVLQLLPRDDANDLFSLATWETLAAADDDHDRWVLPRDEDLKSARDFRNRYAAYPVDDAGILYVAGQADTPCGLLIDGGVRFAQTREGDGRVPWETGLLPKMEKVWYASARHGDLARDPTARAAIVDLLRDGGTSRLSTTRPAATRGLEEAPKPLAREVVAVFPAAADLAAAGAGGTVAAPAPPVLRQMTLMVAHGNLAFAKFPVLVGHYNGDTISGAERQLDRWHDGRLEARRRLRLYPGPIGTAEIIIDPEGRRKDAVVVGLGDPGGLTPAGLEESLVQGLLRYAVTYRDLCALRRKRFDGSLSLSMLLVGSGDGGLPVPTCCEVIVRALQRAQQALAEREDQAHLAQIEIIELYEDRAVETWHALLKLTKGNDDTHQDVQLVPEIDQRDGGRRRIRTDSDPLWWQPIQITVDVVGGEYLLKAITSSGRARAEATSVLGAVEVARRFTAQAISGATATGGQQSENPSRALYELLWPNTLKAQGLGDRNIRLIIDERAATLPWELLDDRCDWLNNAGQRKEPPAVRAGLVRQLVQQRFRERIDVPSGQRRALVIGDPRGDPHPGYGPLPEAEEEAKEVAGQLERYGYAVTRLIGREVMPTQVINALLSHAWTIVHVAAHGDVQKEISAGLPFFTDTADGVRQRMRKATGVVLGKDVFLEPCLLDQMQVPPELFFVNCCHLGKMRPDAKPGATPVEDAVALSGRPELAASFAVQLIRMGVRGVIAAGWAVNDRLGRRFAERFYEGFLRDGEKFGKASRDARESVYNVNRSDPTWGAYQCYGEPDWRIAYGAAGSGNGDRPPFGMLSEAIAAIEQVREDAQTISVRDVAKERENLDAIRKQIEAARPSWAHKADLAAAFAEAYGEIGCLDGAIEYYKQALRAENGQVSVRAVEQLANLQVRDAVRRLRAPEDESEKGAKKTRLTADAARDAIDQAIRSVQALIEFGAETAERWSLIGSAHKRKAQIFADGGHPAELQDALANMAAAYHRAGELAGPDGRPHQLLTVTAKLAQAIIAGNIDSKEVDDVNALLTDCRRWAGLSEDAGPARADDDDSNFTTWASKADTAFLIAIADVVIARAHAAAAPSAAGETDGGGGEAPPKPTLSREQRDRIVTLCEECRGRQTSSLKSLSMLEQVDFFIDILDNLPVWKDISEALKGIKGVVAT